jgi:predicted amidophosphoribosyltransferase
MTLATPLQGPVLLVDDVATSGRHIEEATELLRAKGASVLAVAWIGGDAEKGD